MNAGSRVLILAASAGGGHLIAARALQQAVYRLAPQTSCQTVDVLAICNRLFRRLYAGGYLDIVRYAPTLMGWLYDWMDRPSAILRDRLRVWFQNINKPPIVRFISNWRPNLIICTHYLPAEIVGQMRRSGRLDCPQVVVTTDFETHRIWAQQPAERYYTATEDGKYYLTTWGIDPRCVRVTGIPVRPGFSADFDQRQVRQRCALSPDAPTILLLCGGFGVGPVVELWRQLLTLAEPVQLVVIAGRNERLRRCLEEVARFTRRATRVIGFTEEVHLWMQAADLVVTKPGGLTVAEALACGVPLVVVNPIPGQETRNSDYLLESGAAIKVNHPRLLGHRISTLLNDGERLQRLRSAARAAGRPQAAGEIARDALSLLSSRPV